MRKVVQESILDAAKTGCGSGDLRELISVIDISEQTGGDNIEALRLAFCNYCRSIFSDELRECRSMEQFHALSEDLELVRDHLKVDNGGHSPGDFNLGFTNKEAQVGHLSALSD